MCDYMHRRCCASKFYSFLSQLLSITLIGILVFKLECMYVCISVYVCFVVCWVLNSLLLFICMYYKFYKYYVN